MAVDPLYTSTKEAFLLKIRLDTAKSDQTNAVIDVVISEVRQGFFVSLGPDRALEIAGFTSNDNPTTENENLISMASAAEVLWVTALLMQRLPTTFMEGEGQARQNFNDEPLTRDAADLKDQIKSLLSQKDLLLGQLEEPVNDSSGPVKVFSTGRPVPYSILGNHIGRPIRL